ncbi:DUF2975 domain-containing protein [Flavobacterium sp. SUN052]|uniref:DUF2975 domain-containing protein n=1 Tax=Flavobacterium sp. SUN052 TaxID=3002441 RepID=UPI00237E90DB|nr:DUF2975 domain-containing protein [Flavobacterium sp. SUN052]MEC4003316.1 DUF2975 domain-containing protein [Flavobacterium sp. SUN052]
MRKLQILRTLIDIFWLFSIIAVIGMVIFIPFMFLSKEVIDIPLKINGELIKIDTITKKLILVVVVISYFIFAYGIFLFRKVLSLFQRRIVFDDTVIILLDKVGKCFLVASILTSVSLLFYNIFTKNKDFSIEFGGGFSSFLFTASLGLFFMVLSEVFKISKNIKEENDLTI